MSFFPFFATGATPAYLTDAVALLVAAAVIAYLSFRLRLVPIVGFLLAGILIGPHALGLVANLELVDAAAEVGVILLLFTIGIEFSLEKLSRLRRLILLGGGVQVVLSTLATMGLLGLLGVDWRNGLFAGFLVALSSTAIVLKVLADRNETNSEPGQVALGLLIFQDLAVIVMVLMVPMLGGDGGSATGIIWALSKALALIAGILFFARKLMPRLLEKVAETCSPELFLLSVIAICFGTAYLTSLAGVSLSLGAFLAGLLVSESRFRHHALGEIMPLQILFSATFFVSIGILLDLRFLMANLPMVLAVVAATLVIKIVTTGVSALVLGYRLQVAAASSLMLAQIGEFSFVLERTGREAGLSPAGLSDIGSQSLIAGTVVLMVLTPFMMQIGSRLSGQMRHNTTGRGTGETREVEAALADTELKDHVIIAGYGKAARRLVCVLGGSGIPYIITTLSPEGANEAEAAGFPVLRGDYSRQHILERAGIEHARMIVIADDEPARAEAVVAVAKTLNPTMRTVVRARYNADVEPLARAGTDIIVAEEMESVLRLLLEVMKDYGVATDEIAQHEKAIREGGYAALSKLPTEGEAPTVVCSVNPLNLKRRTTIVRDGAPVTMRPLEELNLAKTYGLTLERVDRNGERIDTFPAAFMLRGGDELIMSGTATNFARVAPLLRNDDGVTGSREATGDGPAPGVGEPRVIDTEVTVVFVPAVDESVCSHVDQIKPVVPSARGCEECLKLGDEWVHLRLCLICGHVGCCDSSKNKHASGHYSETGHPLVKSLEPGQIWGWCYKDEAYV